MNMGVYEKHDRLSYFDPTLPNPAANGHPGALALPRRRNGPRRPPQSVQQCERLGSARSAWPTRSPRRRWSAPARESSTAPNKAPGLNGANNGFTNSPSWSFAEPGHHFRVPVGPGLPGLGGAAVHQSWFQCRFQRAVVWRGRDGQAAATPTSWNFAHFAGAAERIRARCDLYRQQGNAPRFGSRQHHADRSQVCVPRQPAE